MQADALYLFTNSQSVTYLWIINNRVKIVDRFSKCFSLFGNLTNRKSLSLSGNSEEYRRNLNFEFVEFPTPMNCPDCGRNYINNIQLRRHRKECLKERNFVCSMCDKTFKRKYHLRRHMSETHQVTRTECLKEHFVCPICNKTFKRNYHLRRHMSRTHQVTRTK